MKINYLLFVASFVMLSACNVGVKKDLLSGLKISNNGLSYDEAYLIMDDTKFNSNEFPVGKTIKLYMGGVKGFVTKDNMAYFGASMAIADQNGVVILNEPDLFASYEKTGISLEDSEYLTLSLTVGDPIKSGNKYLWKSKVWDKNGEGTILTEIEFTVK